MEVKRRLATLLAKHLPAGTTVDPHTRFSLCGADSRIMTAVLAALGKELGRPLPVTMAWEHPTVAELASAVALPEGTTRPRPLPSPASSGSRDADPIAVVGLACRFPGGESPGAFFDALLQKTDAVRELPADRFTVSTLFDADPEAPGRSSTRWAGTLDAVDGFDAAFFGLSPREAIHMDPQQRLMLELAWEGLEDAGIAPRGLRGSATGVFVGAMWSDYAALRRGALEAIAQHTAVGEDLSVIPARISYGLGLEGPSLSVNTACSSSLVAFHLACQSLAAGDCALALAGAVNLILAPDSLVAMSKFGAMAPDGRSKAFDARANGYVRGEGGGLVVLKRLSQARADGDRIYAVVLGSAVNNDGFSNGLTAPNPRAQEAVLRAAHARAGVAPSAVTLVETHGTGTLLGDPIEANALGAVLGKNRPGAPPLLLGAVKSNIGHLEAAAGMAGLVKTCLAIREGRIPPNLHFQTPNPHVAFESLGLSVPTEIQAWPEGRRIAGVSSFGFGGTNAHVVLGSDEGDAPEILPLAASDDAGLRRAAAVAANALAEGTPWLTVAERANAPATGPSVRAAIVARTRKELIERLRAFAAETGSAEAPRPASQGDRPKLLFVFSPNGSQYRSMARELLSDPVFARAFGACDAACAPWLDWSLREELLHGTDEVRLERIDVGQPLLFAIQVSLAARLAAWGIVPDAVLGHSVGEVAAACVAGALDVEDAARVVVFRSRLMQRAEGRGAMALIDLPPTEVGAQLGVYGGTLQIAGYNGSCTTVVSGDAPAVTRFLTECAERGVEAHLVKRTNIAAHSAHMDPYLETLGAELADLRPQPALVPIYSSVTGAPIEGYDLDAAYWTRNLREPVLFDPTLRLALSAGHNAVVEVSPHPLLARAVSATIEERGADAVVVATQHRDQHPPSALLEVAAALHRRGLALDWTRFGDPPFAAPKDAPDLFCVAAEAPEALAELARRSAAAIRNGEAPLASLCRSSRARRSHLGYRAAVVAGGRAELADKLAGLAASVHRLGAQARVRDAAKVAFVFGGQGTQWWAMGRELLATEPVFRSVVEACDRRIARLAGWSLLDALAGDEQRSRLDEVEVTQPALFAVQAGLFALLRAWGVRPDAVVGHSLGEIAAAYAAGILSFADAVDLTVARARAMAPAAGQGRMLAVEAPASEVAIARYGDRVAVAAFNGPQAIALGGDEGCLTAIRDELAARGISAKFLRGKLAFHCAQMAPAARELTTAQAALRPRRGHTPLVSTVLARTVLGTELDAAYWGRQVVEPVRFTTAIEALLDAGHTAFVEIGPHPALSPSIMQTLEARGAAGISVPTLRRHRPERAALLEAVGELYAHGCAIDLLALGGPAGFAPLPTYPWQRRRYWLDVVREGNAEARVRPHDDETPPASPSLRADLAAADGRARRALLEEHIAGRVAAILLHGAPESLDRSRGFFELGLDSLMVTKLRLELQRDLGRTIPARTAFDYPTVSRLAAHLAEAADAAAAAPRRPARAQPSAEPIEQALLAELAELETLIGATP
ncbi:MAG TPA: acyltransferase domain-containing protein [Polyangiaceae bacterium]